MFALFHIFVLLVMNAVVQEAVAAPKKPAAAAAEDAPKKTEADAVQKLSLIHI